MKLLPFDSLRYWEKRYKNNDSSGAGSFGDLAHFKARIINNFISENKINSVIEFGCGDGNQLTLAKYPQYLGLDISPSGIALCIKKFHDDKTKSFMLYSPSHFQNPNNFFNADLTLSLDVIYHLVEDSNYKKYMDDIFACSKKYVVIYSTNTTNLKGSSHIKHREFTKLVDEKFNNFTLIKQIKNEFPEKSGAEFFIYEKNNQT